MLHGHDDHGDDSDDNDRAEDIFEESRHLLQAICVSGAGLQRPWHRIVPSIGRAASPGTPAEKPPMISLPPNFETGPPDP